MQTVSVYDTGQDTSENFYHAFVLGILVNLDKDYEIKSNRESGIGRYDVMIIPKDTHKKDTHKKEIDTKGIDKKEIDRKEIDRKGIVIEFKRASKKESLEEALERAKNSFLKRNMRPS